MVLIAISAVNCLGQPKRLPETYELKPRLSSPREIARVVNRANRLWSRSRIEASVNLEKVWKQFGIESNTFPKCGGDCEAKIFRHELDSRPGKEVVLKLVHSLDSVRYLVFTSKRFPTGKFRWKFIGHIDHDFNRYEMSSHRVDRALGRNWLIVRGQEGSGSGFYLYGETWYEVSARGIRYVLSYPSEGRTDPVTAGLSWEFKTQPLVVRKSDGQSSIVMRFVARYAANDFAKEKFADHYINRRKAIYVWDKRSRTFVFNRQRSNISEMEIDAVANVPIEPQEAGPGATIGGSTFFSDVKGFVGYGFEMFLKLNSTRLMKIAHGKDPDRREWLDAFLKQCNDIPEKQMLSRALQNQLSAPPKQR